MNPSRRRSRAAVVFALPGVIALALAATSGWREAPTSVPAEQDVDGEVDDALALDPLSAAHGVAGLGAPGPKVAPAAPSGRTPEELLRAVCERVTLVPYEGAMASPEQVLEGGVANALDRARLLASVLARAGHEARVVQVPLGAGAALRHARVTPRVAGEPPAELRAALAARVDALAPRAWARLSRERAWVEAAGDRTGEQSVSWVQVRRAGAWVDLLPPDAVVSEGARGRAVPADVDASRWTVTLRVTNEWADGGEREALALRASAEELHARSVAFTNLPDRSLRRFVPTLVAGERRVEGAAFELSARRELVRQLLHVEVRGPGHARRATRVLVGPRGLANDAERALEVATLARVLVVTGPVGDATHADAVARTLAHGAALARGDDTGWLDAPPLRAVNLLRSSRALAGRVGAAARGCVAFQDRPVVVIERGWVSTHETGLRRSTGLDLVDPGHGFLGAEAARAAVEQGVLDGLLEHVVLSDGDPRSSGAELAALLESGAALSSGRPAGARWSDEVDGAAPACCFAAETGGAVGFRLDPGPQVVPLLHDGTGGATAYEAEAARIDAAARAVSLASLATMLVPAQVVPFMPIMLGLVGYFAEVGKAYVRAASILDGVAAQIAGEGAGVTPDDLEALEELLHGLLPGLAAEIASGFLSQAAGAYALVPALKAIGSGVQDLVSPFARDLLGRLLGAAAGRANPPAAGTLAGARLSFGEIAAKARELRKAGWTPEQVRRYFEELGCFPAGTLVVTATGLRPIESLVAGDRVLSRDPASGAQAFRRITRVLHRRTTQLVDVVVRSRPRQRGRTEGHRQARPDGEDDGEPPPATVSCTPNHPIWRARDGFVPAALLRPGDLLRGDSGEALEVARVVRRDEVAATWNLEVEGWHTYFVAEREGAPAVWVHNTCKGVEVVDGGNRVLAELDRVIPGKRIVEQKSALGVGTVAPGSLSPADWAAKHVGVKIDKIVSGLRSGTGTRLAPGGRGDLPGIRELQAIRHVHFEIESADAAVEAAVRAELKTAAARYPDWKFTARLGTE